MANKRVSLEITIHVVLEPDHDQWETEIIDWEFGVNPPQDFDELPPSIRAALWNALRDEIEECWLGAVLHSSSDATWNWLLEDVDLS